VLSHTSSIFLPEEDEFRRLKEKVIISDCDYTVQPEIFYESILSVWNSMDALLLWRCLSPRHLESVGIQTSPNINHLAMADYSAKNSVPIFTTNFDCLFEEAARDLGYDPIVFLPHTKNELEGIDSFKKEGTPSGKVCIFKLHGSIEVGEKPDLKTLCTTMTAITKANLPTINFLEFLCVKYHITFAGYSGRDVDYFPEIKNRVNKLGNQPFWIDKFTDASTRENCQYINARKIELFPGDLFSRISSSLKRPVHIPTDDEIESILDQLKEHAVEAVGPRPEEKRLLLGKLLGAVGDYSEGYKFLLQLYRNNSLVPEKRAELLLQLSRLAHENSRYVSCRFFAREASKLCNGSRMTGVKVSALTQISESRRMVIPHDTVFKARPSAPSLFIALSSFVVNTGLITLLLFRFPRGGNTGEKVADVVANHDFIEHQIRFVALLQGLSFSLIKANVPLLSASLRLLLSSSWRFLRRRSSAVGYCQGIANTHKFESRINGQPQSVQNGMQIYNLTTSATGKALAVRNNAELCFERKDFTGALSLYEEFYRIGLESGNKLNAIKGLFGIMRCNEELSRLPLLSPEQVKNFEILALGVEGKDWQAHFRKVFRKLK